MMRRLVERHRGILPLDTAESIWRVIIATFTYVQAPFSVHADLSRRRRGDARLRALPFRLHGAVRAASWARPAWSPRSSASKGDLGLVPAFAVAGARRLVDGARSSTSAPKIIARLPFVERADHPAALPVFVISRAGRRRHGDRGRDVEHAGRRLERRPAARASRRWPRSSPCRTAPSTARPCWSRCRTAATLDRRSPTRWSRPAPRCARRPSSAATRPAIRSPARASAPSRPRR